MRPSLPMSQAKPRRGANCAHWSGICVGSTSVPTRERQALHGARQELVARVGRRVRRAFPPQAVVDGEVRLELPVVLREERDLVGREVELEVAELPLIGDVARVEPVGNGAAGAQDVELLGRVGAREDEAAELVEAERLVDVDVVVLEARLHAVRAGEPRQVQRALAAPVVLLVGQERHRAVVADHGLHRRARRVVGQARPLLARVLAARLEQHVRPQRAGVLRRRTRSCCPSPCRCS